MGSFYMVKASIVFNDDAGFGDRKEDFLVQGSHASPLREVPDFHMKILSKKYRNDHWTPDPARKGAGQPASSIRGRIKLCDEAKELARKV